MGNWMTVRIVGTCAADEVRALRARVDASRNYEHVGALSYSASLAGLPLWPAESIDVVGNCFERGYDADTVAAHLEALVEIAPSLAVKVHCGGNYESTACVATVTCAAGVVSVGAPEVEDVGSIPPEQIRRNLERALLGR